MQPYEYETMHRFEDTYWWYQGLRSLLSQHLRDVPAGNSRTALDAGCGTGGNLSYLIQSLSGFEIFALDTHSLAIALTRSRNTGASLLQASVNQVPFQNEVFNLITCLDVLCLETNDREALREFHRVLKPGGLLFINLAAFESLRGEHDDATHTRHRYTARELDEKLKAAGFKVKRITYWNCLLFPLIFMWRKITAWGKKAQEPRSDFRALPFWVNESLKFILRLEEMLLSFVNLPFGSSVFAVAEKPFLRLT